MWAAPRPSPVPAMDHTSQGQLYEWMKKFVDYYNYNCQIGMVLVDSEAYRDAVNGVIMDTIEEFRHGDLVPLAALVIKIMEKTWRLLHPLAPAGMFVSKFDPPGDSPRKHGKEQLVQAPPFFKHDSMMTALDKTPVATDALMAVVLGNLETQFHAGIKDFDRPICRSFVQAQAVRAEQEKRQAEFEKRLAEMKGTLSGDPDAYCAREVNFLETPGSHECGRQHKEGTFGIDEVN